MQVEESEHGERQRHEDQREQGEYPGVLEKSLHPGADLGGDHADEGIGRRHGFNINQGKREGPGRGDAAPWPTMMLESIGIIGYMQAVNASSMPAAKKNSTIQPALPSRRTRAMSSCLEVTPEAEGGATDGLLPAPGRRCARRAPPSASTAASVTGSVFLIGG